ncbi:hypothetical protein ACFL2I_00945, partial [Candidatus Omnitrophota bacterium]
SFTGNVGAITSNTDGSWNSPTTWSETFIVQDVDEDNMVTVSSANARDLAGNPEGPSLNATFELDTEAADAPDQPTSTAAPYINAAEELAGFDIVANLGDSGALAGDSLELLLGGAAFPAPLSRVLTAADIASGGYIFTVASGQLGADGAKAITARIIDAVGSLGTPSLPLNLILDTVLPTATLSVSTDPIYEADLTQEVTITYNENMDPVFVPVISFSGNLSAITSGADGSWTSATTWYETFTVADADEQTAVVSVTSSGAQDIAANPEATSLAANFAIDTQAPINTSVLINDGALYTTSADVTLTLAATDVNGVSRMSISNDDAAYTEYDYAVSLAWTLNASSDGLKTVYVRFRDPAGNWSAVVSDDITLDANAPTATLSVSTDPIYESDLIQEVTVTYNEDMNPAFNPTISFAGNVGAITSNADGSWTSATTWYETFTVADANEQTAVVTATSSGAQDLSGNVETDSIAANFVVDTQAPTIAAATITTIADSATDIIAVVFSESVVEAEAEDLANFSVTSGGNSVNLTGAVINYDDAARTVTIVLAAGDQPDTEAQAGITNLTTGDSYTIDIDNVSDLFANVMTDAENEVILASGDDQPPLLTGLTASPNVGGTGDVIRITAIFNEEIKDSPVPQIALSGGAAMLATDLTKVSSNEYYYDYTILVSDNGPVALEISQGTDLAGNRMVNDLQGNIFAADNTKPTVNSIVVTPDPTPQRAVGELEIRIIFDETMDTNVEPVVSYDPNGLTGPQAASGGSWTSTNVADDTYLVYNDFPIDIFTGVGQAALTVSGAKDFGVGNEMDVYTLADVFTIAGFIITQPTTTVPATPWQVGSADNQITWLEVGSSIISGHLKIEFSADGSNYYLVNNDGIVAEYPAGPGKDSPQLWDIPALAPISSNYTIRITDGGPDGSLLTASDNIISVSEPFALAGGIILNQPAGGEKWAINTQHAIGWTKLGTFDSMVEYNIGAEWRAVSAGGAADAGIPGESLTWQPSDDLAAGSATVQIRVSDANTSNPPSSATSGLFTICDLALDPLVIPGNRIQVGDPLSIGWQHVGLDFIRLEYYSNIDSDYRIISGAEALVAGSSPFVWTMPDDVGDNVGIRATAVNTAGVEDPNIEGLVQDISPEQFTIHGQLVFDPTSPGMSAGGSSAANLPLTLSFTGSASINTLNFYYKTSLSGAWIDFTAEASYTYADGAGTVEWMPTISGNAVYFKVEDANDVLVFAETAFPYTLSGVAFDLSVLDNSPYVVAQPAIISGTATVVGNILLEYSTTGAAGGYSLLGPGADNVFLDLDSTFSYTWTIPDQIGNNIFLRATDILGGATDEIGPIIIRAGLTVNALDGPWAVGQTRSISGNVAGSATTVALYYTIDGTTWTLLQDSSGADLSEVIVNPDNTFNADVLVPDAMSTTFQVKATDSTFGRPANALGESAPTAAITVKARLVVVTPTQRWLAGKEYELNWNAFGSLINQVRIEYAYALAEASLPANSAQWQAYLDKGVAVEAIEAEAGVLNWPVADVVAALGDPQLNPIVYMKLAVIDTETDELQGDMDISAAFQVRYSEITWRVLDADLSFNLFDVTVMEKAGELTTWEQSALSSPVIHYYPYFEQITTSWGKTGYVGTSLTWISNYAETDDFTHENIVYLQNEALATQNYSAEIRPQYNASADRIDLSCWLLKRGLLVLRDNYDNQAGSIDGLTIEVFDNTGTLIGPDSNGLGLYNSSDMDTPIATGKWGYTESDPNGVFTGISCKPTAPLRTDAVYTIKASITHLGVARVGYEVFTIPPVSTYEVNIEADYDTEADAVISSVWLSRSGVIVSNPEVLRFNVFSSDDTDVSGNLSADKSANANGIFSNVVWDPAEGLTGGIMYTLVAEIDYRNNTYSASKGFVKPAGAFATEAAQAAGAAAEEIRTEVSGVGVIATQARDAAESAEEAAQETVAEVSGVREDLSATRLATEQTALEVAVIEAQTQEAKDIVETVEQEVSSQILNTESSIRQGEQLMINYKAESGLLPRLTVYDANNNLVPGYENKAMKETAPGSGRYQAPMVLNESGDYTVLCKTEDAMDAITMNVQTSDIQTIGEDLSATTAQMFGMDISLRELLDRMSYVETIMLSVFGSMDEYDALTDGQGEGKGKMTGQATDELYSQVSDVAASLAEVSDQQGVNFKTMYEISESQSDNFVYLRNKALEVRALMEINREMLERSSDQPIIKSWFESAE